MFLILMILGTIIRLFLLPLAGFKADMAFWKGWGLAAADKGILWLVKSTNYNYPPGFGYVLYVVNKIYALFKNPYNINEYWSDTNLLYLFLIKIITIAADIGIVILILKIADIIQKKLHLRSRALLTAGKIWAILYFLNPAAIFDGSHWGQVDQLGLFLFLLTVYFLFKEMPLVASMVFVVSVLTKFQNIIFIPLFYLYIYKKYSIQAVGKSLFVSLVAFLVIAFPFWTAHEMDSLIRLLTINADWFPWFSLNSFNMWWIASGLRGMQVVDKTLVWGVLSAKQIGFLLFVFAYFVGCVSIFFAKKEQALEKFILASTLAIFAFFHLLTQSHERYLFHALGLIPLLVFFSKKNYYGTKLLLYAALSVVFFFNLYIAMFFNYPDQVFWPISADATRFLTLYLSFVQIALFVIFLAVFILPEITRRWILVGSFGLLLIGFAGYKNFPYYLEKPISLTQIKPIWWGQSYLNPVYNKTVESDRGPSFWNRLSDNYFFYEKGIGSHADSDIAYSLKGKFSRFKSDFGIDTEGDVNAKVYFSLDADGKEVFKSQVKGRFDPPSSVDVDITGADQLVLKIRKAGDSIYGAHADWLNPVLIR